MCKVQRKEKTLETKQKCAQNTEDFICELKLVKLVSSLHSRYTYTSKLTLPALLLYC